MVFEYLYPIEVSEASLIIFHKYFNYLLINELDEFKWNECLCIVWCSL